jgi:hypothetical protein
MTKRKPKTPQDKLKAIIKWARQMGYGEVAADLTEILGEIHGERS